MQGNRNSNRREKNGLEPVRKSERGNKAGSEVIIKKEPHYITFTIEGIEDDSTEMEEEAEASGHETKVPVRENGMSKSSIKTDVGTEESLPVTEDKFMPSLSPGKGLDFGDMFGDLDVLAMPTEGLAGLSSALFCPVTVQWLLENYETKAGVSLPRSTVYNHYIRHCRSHEMEPVNAASFGKLIRSIFLGLQTRRLGTRGNSKYHYYGIQIKPDSLLNDVHENESGTQSDSEGEDEGLDVVPNDQLADDNVTNANNEEESVEVPDPEELATSMYVNCRLEPKSFFSLKSNVPQYNEVKEVTEWQGDIKLITKFTCDPSRKDLLRKIRQETNKLGADIPKIDYKLVSDRLSRGELENFRQSYKKFHQMLIRSCVLYKLDTLLIHCSQYWTGIPLLSKSLHFTKDKLKHICENEAIRLFIQSVDCQLYDIMLDLLFPDILNPIPVVVIDVVRNFARKYVKSLGIILTDYSNDMRATKCSTAEAFSRIVLDRCRLNMLADALRPLFEQGPRSQSYRRLKELNVPAALSVSIYPIANEDKYFYLVETYRQTLANITSLDIYAEWIRRELKKAVGHFKGPKDVLKFDDAARVFVKDTSYILYVICSQMVFMDEEANSFFSTLHMFTNEYILYLLEGKRANLKSESVVQYTHSLSSTRA